LTGIRRFGAIRPQPCRIMEAAPQTMSDDSATSKSRWARATAEASGDARETLSELAASYDYCVYAWWRRAGREAEAAMAATLAAFDRWLGASPLFSIHSDARSRTSMATG
jgi:hypothetical protein